MAQSLSLSEFCSLVSASLELTMPDSYWVRAEVSSLTVRGGHCYMELVEKSSDGGLLAAKVRATCWQNVYSMLSVYFQTETGKPLAVGMQLLIEVKLQYHAVYGLSLQVVGIDPQYTLGDLVKQRDLTIKRLQKEGIMDMQHLLSLPTLPLRLAVVSSADAAGYQDFCNQLLANNNNYRFSLSLFTAVMQGDRAPQSICEALNEIYENINQYDAVVIVRGGGATTDLTAFDDYELACACAQFPLPIITGIGHQKDVAIVDLVAFQALKTPTAAAEYMLQLLVEQDRLLTQLKDRLLHTADRRILILRHQLDYVKQRWHNLIGRKITLEKEYLHRTDITINLLSPENIYKKGYTITFADGKMIKSINEVKKGQILTTEFIDGKVQSTVL